MTGVILHQKIQSRSPPCHDRASLSPPNDEWLKDQVDSEEFANKSEAVNALIRKAREAEKINEHLIKAELSGFTAADPKNMLAEFKQTAKTRGLL